MSGFRGGAQSTARACIALEVPSRDGTHFPGQQLSEVHPDASLPVVRTAPISRSAEYEGVRGALVPEGLEHAIIFA